MKKSIYFFISPIILVLLVFFNYKYLESYKEDIYRQNDLNNFSTKNQIKHLETALMVHYALENNRIKDEFFLCDTLGKINKIDNLNSKRKFCLKFSKYVCPDCLTASINFLKKFDHKFLESDVFVITDAYDQEELKFRRKELSLPSIFFYHKMPMFENEILCNSTLFFILDGRDLINTFEVNPATVKYLDLYFKSLTKQFKL